MLLLRMQLYKQQGLRVKLIQMQQSMQSLTPLCQEQEMDWKFIVYENDVKFT